MQKATEILTGTNTGSEFNKPIYWTKRFPLFFNLHDSNITISVTFPNSQHVPCIDDQISESELHISAHVEYLSIKTHHIYPPPLTPHPTPFFWPYCDESASQHSISIMTLWCIHGMGGIKNPDWMPQGSNCFHYGFFISLSNLTFRMID